MLRFETLSYKRGSRLSGLMKNPSIVADHETFTIRAAHDWFDMLLAALDCYFWTFSQGLLTPAVLKSTYMS